MYITIIKSIYFWMFMPYLLCMIPFKIKYKNKKKIGFLLCLIMTLFTGFRWETGTDWNSYYNLFKQIQWDNVSVFYHFDIGYKLTNLVIKTFYDNYTFFLLITSAVAIYLVYFAICRTDANIFISLALFYSTYFLAHYFGSNRRIISIGFGLCMFVSIYEKKYKRAWIFYILAILFHRTSVVMVLAFYVPKVKINNVKAILLVFVSGIIGMFDLIPVTLQFFFTKCLEATGLYAFNNALYHLNLAYLENMGSIHNVFGIIKRMIIMTLFIVLYPKSKKDDELGYLFNIYVLSIFLYNLFVGIGTYTILTTYFSITEIIIWGCLYEASGKNSRTIIICTTVGLCLTEIMTGYSEQFAYCFFPYQSIFG